MASARSSSSPWHGSAAVISGGPCAQRAGDVAFAAAHARLSAWLKRADYITPFDFFAEALGPEGGRVALLERLGREAADPIDELLARALQYQRAEGGSLQGFLRWFEAGGGEIKRDLDQNRRREVRILTVHASKGLQAPIVYLPDTTRVPRDTERLLTGVDGEARLWLPRADDANEAARSWRAQARERALEEQNRLLYVAMTRAEDRLYVGGWVGAKKPDRGCWYERIEAGLRASSDAGVVRRISESRGRARLAHFRLYRPSSALRAGRATAMSSSTPATSRCPNRPSCRSRWQPGWSPGRISRRRPSPIHRHRWRPRNRCRTRRSRARAPSAPWRRAIRGAGSAVGCCTNCCAICRLCPRRRVLQRRDASSRSRRTD